MLLCCIIAVNFTASIRSSFASNSPSWPNPQAAWVWRETCPGPRASSDVLSINSVSPIAGWFMIIYDDKSHWNEWFGNTLMDWKPPTFSYWAIERGYKHRPTVVDLPIKKCWFTNSHVYQRVPIAGGSKHGDISALQIFGGTKKNLW